MKLARQYDRGKLDAQNLQELAHLLDETEEPAAAIEAGKEWVARFATVQPQRLPRVRRLMADAALRLGKDAVDEAVARGDEQEAA